MFATFTKSQPTLRERLAVIRLGTLGLSISLDTCNKASSLLSLPNSPSIFPSNRVENASTFITHNSKAKKLSKNKENANNNLTIIIGKNSKKNSNFKMSREGSNKADKEDKEVAVAASSSKVVNQDALDKLPLYKQGFIRRDRERCLKASQK